MTWSTPKNSQYHITAGNDAAISQRVVPRQQDRVDEHLHRHEALADDERQRELEQFLRPAGRRVLEC